MPTGVKKELNGLEFDRNCLPESVRTGVRMFVRSLTRYRTWPTITSCTGKRAYEEAIQSLKLI